MTENFGTITAAVSLLIKAALLAAGFSGRVRRRSLKRLAAMDTDAKARENLFLKGIDHFSRKVVCVVPLVGANAGWIIDALEQAMQEHGSPKHIISDQAKVFIGDAFTELLKQWDVKPRLGAVGKHGSIAVTERVIKTLKYEWLRCVPLIRGLDDLAILCTEFAGWYNAWRPHMALEGLRPDDLYYDRKPDKPKPDAKTVPSNIERHVFAETRLTAYRLKNAA